MKNWILLVLIVLPFMNMKAQTECRLIKHDGTEMMAMTSANDAFNMSDGFIYHHNGKTHEATPQDFSHVKIGQESYEAHRLASGDMNFLKVEVNGNIMVFSHNYLITTDLSIEMTEVKEPVKIAEPIMTSKEDDEAMMDTSVSEEPEGILDAMMEEEIKTEFYIKVAGNLKKISEENFKQELPSYVPGLIIPEDRRYADIPDLIRNRRRNK